MKRRRSGGIRVAERPGTYGLRWVIDASCAVKWFEDETDSDLARMVPVRAASGACRLLAPDLLRVEVTGALLKVRKNDLESILEDQDRLERMGIEFHRVTAELTREAARLGVERSILAADATYVALASLNGAVVVTDDRTLLRKLSGTGLAVGLLALRESLA